MSTPTLPDRSGHFGEFGGKFVIETLMPALKELEQLYNEARNDPEFQKQLKFYLKHYVGRPSPLYFAQNLTRKLGGAKIYLKREDLNHTGAHKINNTIGSALLTQRMGKKRVIAETGAGQHGVATATAAALFDLECDVFMGEEDIRRQALNVFRMKLLGARVIPVSSGTRTLKDAMQLHRIQSTTIRDAVDLLSGFIHKHPHPLYKGRKLGTYFLRGFDRHSTRAFLIENETNGVSAAFHRKKCVFQTGGAADLDLNRRVGFYHVP